MSEKQVSSSAESTTEQSVSSESLLDTIAENTGYKKEDGNEFITAKSRVTDLLKVLVQSERINDASLKVNKSLIDEMILEIDAKISQQLDEVLHDENFQTLESAWRGLKYVVDQTDFQQNIKIDLINATKEELAEEFEDELDITATTLYKKVYTAEFGQSGGEAYGAVIGNYDFSPSGSDITLMRKLAQVSAMSHAPFVAAASPSFFERGAKDFSRLPKLNNVQDYIEDSPEHIAWKSFRESEDARYLCLTMPRFLLRAPYDPNNNPVKGFQYKEQTETHGDYLWGNTAFAFASRLSDSFAQYGWCTNITGPKGGGTVEALPLHHYESDGQIETKIPTEALISYKQEYDLAESGFIPLVYKKETDEANFFSANSIQKAKVFNDDEEGQQAATNYKLSGKLPYMMIANRLSHYIKVLQSEEIGSSMTRVNLEEKLSKWLKQYVSDQDNASPAVMARQPLRQAAVSVDEIPGETGWYKVSLNIRPHQKYEGAYFDLSLVGKLKNDQD